MNLVKRHLSMPNNQAQYFCVLPGRLLSGDADGSFDLSGSRLTAEQKAFVQGTVLESLLMPERLMHLEVRHETGLKYYPIPAVRIEDLEPRAVYDADQTLIGTRIRLPGIHTCANAVFSAQEKGMAPDLESLYLSYCADLSRLIDDHILRIRYSPGVSAIAMGGDSTLLPGQIAITRKLANHLLDNLILGLDPERRAKLRDKVRRDGPGILHGYPMTVQRDPATVYGAVKERELCVIDVPGNALYIRSEDINEAGGDFDGDFLRCYDSTDPTGLRLFEYLMGNKPKILKKKEDFSVGTIHATRKGITRVMDLKSVTWHPEDEVKIMAEFKEKGLIGRAWYDLVQYQYLFAHHFPDGYHKPTLFKARIEAVHNYSKKNPKSDVAKVYSSFRTAYPKIDARLMENEEFKEAWAHMAYVAIAESFFVVYESIFDLRKGDSKLPFVPSEILTGLMGYSNNVDWDGMEEGGIWTEPLRLVYNTLPVDDKGRIDFGGATAQHPAFNALVTNRSLLTARAKFRSIQALAPYMFEEDFASWLMQELLRG